MVVYLDAVWLLNVLIDACLLKLTALMMKRQVGALRLWIGAFIASAVVLVLFTPVAFLVLHPLGKLVYSAVIILTVFGFRRLSVFLQNLAAFYFTAFAIGGGLFAVHYFFQDASFYAGNHFFTTMNYGDPISWITVCVGFPVLWLFSKRRIDQTAVRKWNSTTIATVTVSFADFCIDTRAMVDSGNKLIDPVTRAPVMFLEKSLCGHKVPDALVQQENGNGAAAIADLNDIPEQWRSRLAWVPYRAVDGSERIAVAVRPDDVRIVHEGCRIACTKSLVVFVAHPLSSSGDFHGILHPDMLLNGKMIETAS